MRNKLVVFWLTTVFAVVGMLFTGCGGGNYAESDTLILSAEKAISLLEEDNWILVDAQKTTSYEKEHIVGAVNIERAQITIKEPVPNTLAPGAVVADAAGKAGLTENDNVLIYDDNNNMDSGRLAWTLMVYGHKGELRIVSGGLAAMQEAGAEITSGTTNVSPAVYTASSKNNELIADKEQILSWLNNPVEDVKLLDVRTDEEYNAGTIPGSIHVDYLEHNFSDGTYRPVQHIRICYKDVGIMPEHTVIIYCKSSIRAAQTFAALYNAGYRKLKVYDGAWLEWSADPDLPVYKPEIPGNVQIQVEDAS